MIIYLLKVSFWMSEIFRWSDSTSICFSVCNLESGWGWMPALYWPSWSYFGVSLFRFPRSSHSQKLRSWNAGSDLAFLPVLNKSHCSFAVFCCRIMFLAWFSFECTLLIRHIFRSLPSGRSSGEREALSWALFIFLCCVNWCSLCSLYCAGGFLEPVEKIKDDCSA